MSLFLLLPLTANATVIYEFTADSSFALSDFEIDTATFVVEATDFITSDTYFDPSDLLSCSVLLVTGLATCEAQGFLFSFETAYDTIALGLSSTASLGSHELYYYFERGAFGAVGSYDTQLFGDIQSGRLSVSQVPEPISLALLLIGMFALVSQTRKTSLLT